MTAIKSHHSRVFERLAAEHRMDLIDALIGGAVVDFPMYRQIVGQLQGLDDALKLSEQADFELSGDEPHAGA